MQGGAVVTSTSDVSDELPPMLRVQFTLAFFQHWGTYWMQARVR
jgi:hypothetical protein